MQRDSRTLRASTLVALAFGPLAALAPGQTVTVDAAGGIRRWHAVTLTLTGPASAETAPTNPFLDLRMQVTFQHRATALRYVVPGYFAADGRAADTGADAGDRWRAHLSPDHTGAWDYTISFRAGAGVAVDANPTAGTALAPFDGTRGSFTVLETDKGGRDLRGRGRLRYVGAHHLQFADGGWFLKVGADSPENLLAYDDFDNTPNTGSLRKSWAPHLGDWQTGDPTWGNGRGKGLIGALNYLASEQLSAVSFLTYSYNGDDKNVFPYRDPTVRTRMDCSKLDQWGIVLAHAGRVGLFLHFKTQETENDQDMDGGALGTERILYYRELVARYAHLLALNWNLGEENSNTTAQRQQFARWFHDHDPYRHPVVVHTFPADKSNVYTPLLGSGSTLAGASLQSGAGGVFADTLEWVDKSRNAGRPWVCANDEQGPANVGVMPDSADPQHDAIRQQVLWGNLLAGGAGIECYFGYAFAHSDLTCNDFRSRDLWWDQCRHAKSLFLDHRVPFHAMRNADARVDRGHCLANADYHVVYLPAGGVAQLDLRATSGTFDVLWFDPRGGGALQVGATPSVTGGAWRSLGAAPREPTRDWAILVRRSGPAATVVRYGAGCPGTAALVPALATAGVPALGAHAFAIRIEQARPAAAVVFALGDTRLGLPLAGGCTLLADGILVPSTTDYAGRASLPLPVPFDVGLLGAKLCCSGAVEDPAGAYLGLLAFADAVEVRLGF
ncbi:MAG: DUF5060 domain-containing protein [Planctomycetes bacterium]|nr:DUF5060 domain-containing protein [Planctomycetota bacterium]